MRENLQSCGHLERIKGRPCGQQANRARTPIPGLLQSAHNAGVVATAGIAEHANFPSDYVLKDGLARTDLLGQFLRTEPPQKLVRKTMGADFKVLSRQS